MLGLNDRILTFKWFNLCRDYTYNLTCMVNVMNLNRVSHGRSCCPSLKVQKDPNDIQYNLFISAFVYHPKTDKCWPAFRKGPCEDGQYLVLNGDSAIPVCEKNPCTIDSYVQYKGRCEQLASITPCMHMWPIPAALTVNSTTLTVSCERLNLESRFGERIPAKVSVTPCPPGCKRSVTGKCITMTSS